LSYGKRDAKVKIITNLNDIDDDDDIDDDGYSYYDLVRMLGEVNDYMHKEKEKFRTLKELCKNLQVYFDELKTSHMCLVAGQLGIGRTWTSPGILSRPSNFEGQLGTTLG
jgi:hypothetical protein